jgi:hypothetical protein
VGGTSLLAFLAFTLTTSDVPEEKVLSTGVHERLINSLPGDSERFALLQEDAFFEERACTYHNG